VARSSRRIQLDNYRYMTWWRGSAPRVCTSDELPRQSPFHVPTKLAHAITSCRREGTNWVNRSSAFYNSLRNRKNKYASLSRLTWEQKLKSLYFWIGSQKKSLTSSITWIYITLVESWVQIKENKWEHAVWSCSTPINSVALWSSLDGWYSSACFCVWWNNSLAANCLPKLRN